MSTPPSKPKKSSWRQQMAATHAAVPVDQLEATRPTPQQVPTEQKMLVEIRGFRFMNPENGFVIAHGKAKNDPIDLPAAWKGRWNKEQVTLKGSSPLLAHMGAIGSVVEVQGEWVMDPKFGLQYQFQWVREAMPSSLEALEAYLSAGRIKGIGPATAKLMIAKWGMDTLTVLSDRPEELATLPGLTPDKVEVIKKVWAEKKAIYQLTSFFGLYGIGEVWIPKIVEALGPNALEARVRDNPYLLTQVDGIGFTTADHMALALGLEHTAPIRVKAMLLHLLNEYTTKQGHTARMVDDWFKDASQQLSLPNEALQPVAQELVNKGQVVVRTLPVNTSALLDQPVSTQATTPVMCVSLKRDVVAERTIAADLARLRTNIKPLTSEETMVLNKGIVERSQILDSSQIEGALGVLSNGVSILTGGPGTGKTTTLKSVIDIAEEMGWQVCLAAPTGRAAKRMREAIGRPAQTLHMTLDFSFKQGGFGRNRSNPITSNLVVVDEASMIDNALASALLRAISDGARIIFVGDIDQLPSVGAGAFLKDILQSQAAPVFRLTRVHRQTEGSLIAEAAQNVLAGRLPPLDGDPWTDDFAWIKPPSDITDSTEVNEFISTSISSLVDGFLKQGYKKEDIQVLSPQRDGVVGVIGLNNSLRWQLNEEGVPTTNEEAEQSITLGDRLLVTKNNYDKNIFNGDMGIVKKIDNEDGTLELLMEDGQVVQLDRLDRKNLTLGYAITVHKSQGGERPIIILSCSPSHTFSMNKNLIYTGITRGKNKVVVVGQPKTLQSALRKQEKMYRLTGLVDEIHKVLPPPSPGIAKSFQPK